MSGIYYGVTSYVNNNTAWATDHFFDTEKKAKEFFDQMVAGYINNKTVKSFVVTLSSAGHKDGNYFRTLEKTIV